MRKKSRVPAKNCLIPWTQKSSTKKGLYLVANKLLKKTKIGVQTNSVWFVKKMIFRKGLSFTNWFKSVF